MKQYKSETANVRWYFRNEQVSIMVRQFKRSRALISVQKRGCKTSHVIEVRADECLSMAALAARQLWGS